MLAASLATSGCHSSHQEAAEAVAATSDPKIESGRIVFPEGSLQLGTLHVEPAVACPHGSLRLGGRLVWDENATVRVFSPFAGRTLKVTTEIGQKVAAGEMLAVIASPDFGQAQADARKAGADLLLAQRSLTRLRELAEHGAAAAKDVAGAENDLARAEAENRRAQSRLALFGADGNATDNNFALLAPVGGVLVERNLAAGQEVRPDQMLAGIDRLAAPLFVLTDPSRLWLALDVNETDLARLHPGQSVRLRSPALGQREFTGTIEVVSDSLDPVTRTARVRASVPNPDRLLKAEMLVWVDVAIPVDHLVDVDARAVFLKGEKHFIFAEAAPGHFERREVRISGEHEGRVQIDAGLNAGDRVVTYGALLLEQIHDSAGT